jgi:hypothetical protein
MIPEPAERPLALHDRAMDNLRFIRQTMERAGSFTALSGWGFVAIGVTAIGAAWLAALQPTPQRWLAVWLGEAVLAVLLALGSTGLKAHRSRTQLLAGPGRKLLLSFGAPALAAALLTAALYAGGVFFVLPALWLLLYGAGVVTAGAYSVRPVPLMGAAFMALGGIALAVQPHPDLAMAAGFGALHLGFGVHIARRHGG